MLDSSTSCVLVKSFILFDPIRIELFFKQSALRMRREDWIATLKSFMPISIPFPPILIGLIVSSWSTVFGAKPFIWFTSSVHMSVSPSQNIVAFKKLFHTKITNTALFMIGFQNFQIFIKLWFANSQNFIPIHPTRCPWGALKKNIHIIILLTIWIITS